MLMPCYEAEMDTPAWWQPKVQAYWNAGKTSDLWQASSCDQWLLKCVLKFSNTQSTIEVETQKRVGTVKTHFYIGEMV